ncbi:MAG: NYN domain-containing protein [Ktedonobacterales bacterium]|nr:NYN domain-containing protein [Ktedonobacterales bacterium]
MSEEIALFIDFENIRYSLLNVQHREPDPQELIGVARHFGTVMVARAYADWTRQPEFFKGSLTAAMIDRVDCPAKVRERFRQNTAQVQMYQQHATYERALPPTDEEEYIPAGDAEGLPEEHQHEHPIEGLVGEAAVIATKATETHAEVTVCTAEEEVEERRGRIEAPTGYTNGGYYPQQQQQPPQQQTITQSTVDLNMLMDIIETVFDRPSITTFVLMSGDRDFTRICARLKLRLNKRVIVVGVPGTVSRDLISAAEQFVPLGFSNAGYSNAGYNNAGYSNAGGPSRLPQHGALPYPATAGPVEPEEMGFIQFLDYIDRHWSWRTISGIANFIGDPFNPKNRFRGRLTRDSARDLLRLCVDEGILLVVMDPMGGENLRLNREHPAVVEGLSESPLR